MNKNQKRLSAWSSALLMSLASVGTVGTANAVVYDADVTLNTSPKWGENVTINPGVSVTLGEDVITGQTTAITVDIDGTLTMNTTKTGNHDANNSLATTHGITFTGAGTFVKTGTGKLGMACNDNLPVKFAMESGALIDIQAGTLVNGGWSKQNWTENKADMQIAEDASLDIWDGSNIYIDSLVGAGTVRNGSSRDRTLVIGVDGSGWTATGTAPVFSGDFLLNNMMTSIEKQGNGTQILSGDFLSKGTINVTAGTLQIGDGTNGSIGGNHTGITVADGATLAFNTDTAHTFNKVSGTGTIDVQKGTVTVVEKFGGSFNVGQNGTVSVLYNDFFTSGKNTVADGATLYLNVNDAEADTTAFRSTAFNELRTEGKYTVGIYTQAGTTATADINNILGTDTVLTKMGTGTIGLTGENTAFTAGIVINEGGLGVGDGTTAGKISPTLAVTVNADGSFVYNNGAGTTTELLENITGDGKLVVASGILQVTKNSPTYLENSDYATRFAVSGVTIKDSAKLYIADEVTPTFSKADGTKSNGVINIEAGGVMEVNNADSGGHGSNNSLAHSSCNLTITGAGTFLKTGNGAVAFINRDNNTTASVTIQQNVGGWIDVQDGELIIGGWSSNINWKNNKGSLNLAEGATANLWDGGCPITIDNLTGKGTVSRNGVIVGAGNNANSEKYGVANNTATFEGKIVDDSSHVGIVTKLGSGTQILANDNSYTGATKVVGGTLQFGNGGATGKIGSGAVSINQGATLAFDTTRDNEFASLGGNGTLAVKNTGNVTVAGGIDTFDGTIDVQNADTMVQFSPVAGATETFTGNVTGNGTVKLNMQSDSVVNMASAMIGQNATFSANGGVLVLPKAYDGTVQATGDMTVTLAQNTIQPWTMTFYAGDSTLGGKITPTTPLAQVNNYIDYGTAFDMNQVANNVAKDEVKTYMVQSYAAFSYKNVVQITEDITIDLSGSYDDSQSVWTIQCDENGQIADGAEWVALLNYGTNCQTNTKTGVDLSAGYYLFDIRVSDNTGDRYANGYVKDKDGKALGIGIRLNGETNYAAFDINPETGVIAGISQMVSVGDVVRENYAFAGKLDIADGATLTFDNPYNDAKTYDIDTTVTGKGTLALTNSGNANATYDVNIDSAGSLSIADAMNVTLAGNIDGDLTLGDNVVLNFELATTDTAPVVTVGGDVALGENGIVNVFLTGDTPEDGVLLDLALISTTGENAVVDFDPAKTNFVFSDPNLRLFASVVGYFGKWRPSDVGK